MLVDASDDGCPACGRWLCICWVAGCPGSWLASVRSRILSITVSIRCNIVFAQPQVLAVQTKGAPKHMNRTSAPIRWSSKDRTQDSPSPKPESEMHVFSVGAGRRAVGHAK